MDGVKGCLSDRGLSVPEAKECLRDRREWRRIVGGGVDDPGWSRLYKTVKAVDVEICYALRFDSSEGKSDVWVESMLCDFFNQFLIYFNKIFYFFL